MLFAHFCVPMQEYLRKQVSRWNGKHMLLSLFLAAALSLQDLRSLTRSQTQAQAGKAQSPNHWATREFFATFFNNCNTVF